MAAFYPKTPAGEARGSGARKDQMVDGPPRDRPAVRHRPYSRPSRGRRGRPSCEPNRALTRASGPSQNMWKAAFSAMQWRNPEAVLPGVMVREIEQELLVGGAPKPQTLRNHDVC